MVCSAISLISTGVVIARVAALRASLMACLFLMMFPLSLLLWCCYTRSVGVNFSPIGKAVVCAGPALSITVYMRMLLRQGHGFGLQPIVCPGQQVRRWICCAIATTALAMGWARVWCYPTGLVAGLSESQGFEWYLHWLLSALAGCSTTLLWWQALQRCAQIAREPARWKESWAWWSLPHRQYLLFLMLLLTPLLRLSGFLGALLSDDTVIEEPVGFVSPLLAVVAASIFFLGLDFEEETALELELLQMMCRCVDASPTSLPHPPLLPLRLLRPLWHPLC